MLIDKVALLYWQDGKILSSRSKGKDTWYLPGGKREGSESDVETLVREIEEELSVSVDPETAVYYGTFEAKGRCHCSDDLLYGRLFRNSVTRSRN